MKRLKRNKLLAFLLLGLLFSCSRKEAEDCSLLKEVNGIWIDSDDRVYSGRCSSFNDGKMQSSTDYLNGKPHGKTRFYFDNGRLKEEVTFNNGVSQGKVTYYYESGQKQISGQTSKGLKDGEWIQYFVDGRLKSKVLFRNDKENGQITEYFMNGNTKTTGMFSEGIQHGNWFYYDSITGRKVGVIKYDKGKTVLVKDL